MTEILTVCTGNICRSPLAALVLTSRLGGPDVHVHSAGTHAMPGMSMTPEAQRIARGLGVAEADAAAHRARRLGESMLAAPDLILTMTREQRRVVVELAPARARSVFTVREFARLSADIPDSALRRAAGDGHPASAPEDVAVSWQTLSLARAPRRTARTDADDDAAATGGLRPAVAAVAAQRGLAPPAQPDDDDVVDPYRRELTVYRRAAAQLVPALDAVIRVVRSALLLEPPGGYRSSL